MEKIDVFISFKNTENGQKTPDASLAVQLKREIESKNNLNPFTMTKLSLACESNYRKAIDKALDEANYLIVVGSKPEFFKSGWLEYEWGTYLGEVISNRKKGEIFTVRMNGMQISDLPLSLRKYQSFESDNLEEIYNWLPQKEGNRKKGNKPQCYQFLYPAIFRKVESTGEYKVVFPDLNIETSGTNLSEAYIYSKDLLKVFFSYCLRFDLEYNKPTKLEDIKQNYPTDMIMYVDTIVDEYMFLLPNEENDF